MNSVKIAKAGSLRIGGDNPVSVQTMYDDSLVGVDPAPIIERINKLSLMGCDMIRFSFVSKEDAPVFSEICKRSPIPVVADIHFDYHMALMALECGADKVRINPGNIGVKWKTEEVVRAAKDHGAAIRIGLNTGSLPKHCSDIPKYRVMVESALEYIDDFESWGFENIVVSLKSSDIETTVKAAEEFSKNSPYPIHLGVTEAGSVVSSAVRTTWVIGNLLSRNIGDTLRVSINGSIEDEVRCGVEILRALGLRQSGVRVVACPRCGRHTFDSQAFLSVIEPRLLTLNKPITVAVMGCQVNGPGEAKDADYAVTGFGTKVFLYKKGQLFREVTAENAESELFEAIENE